MSRCATRLRYQDLASPPVPQQTRRVLVDVIDDQTIDRQRPKPHHLLGHDGLQLIYWRRLLRWSNAIEANSGLPRAQLLRK
jgi:hypothetical protein